LWPPPRRPATLSSPPSGMYIATTHARIRGSPTKAVCMCIKKKLSYIFLVYSYDTRQDPRVPYQGGVHMCITRGAPPVWVLDSMPHTFLDLPYQGGMHMCIWVSKHAHSSLPPACIGVYGRGTVVYVYVYMGGRLLYLCIHTTVSLRHVWSYTSGCMYMCIWVARVYVHGYMGI
jgi:hypothetical protein